MTHATRLSLVGTLLLVALAPPLIWWWEASLVRHMLVQFPLLIFAGIALGAPGRPVRRDQAGGVAAILLAMFSLAFWMLPRWLDAAVGDGAVNAIKSGSLVLLTGAPLAWGWARVGMVARGFILANAISMFLILGLLYRTFPDRLCNNYLASEQPVLGLGMFAIAALLALALGIPALAGNGARARPEGSSA